MSCGAKTIGFFKAAGACVLFPFAYLAYALWRSVAYAFSED